MGQYPYVLEFHADMFILKDLEKKKKWNKCSKMLASVGIWVFILSFLLLFI